MDLKLVLRRFMAADSGKVTQRRRPECLADHLVTLQCIERNIKSAREVADSGGGNLLGIRMTDISVEGIAGIKGTANSIETGGDQASYQHLRLCRIVASPIFEVTTLAESRNADHAGPIAIPPIRDVLAGAQLPGCRRL